jgi:methionine synthase II (cobalamin-independent)
LPSDEVLDLEKARILIIQIDEPAIREGWEELRTALVNMVAAASRIRIATD